MTTFDSGRQPDRFESGLPGVPGAAGQSEGAGGGLADVPGGPETADVPGGAVGGVESEGAGGGLADVPGGTETAAPEVAGGAAAGGAAGGGAAVGGLVLSVGVASGVAPLVSDVRVAGVVARCGGLSPGPELVALLCSVEVGRLAVADRLEVAVVWQRVANWVAAQRLLAIAAAAGPLERSAQTAVGDAWSLTGDEVDDMVCAEIGAALCVSPRTAAGLVDTARAAVGPVAPLTQRMLAGDFGQAHLDRAVTLCAQASPQVALDAVTEVAGKAPARCTPTQLRGRLHRALVKRDPDAVRRRTRAASRQRGVGLWADPDLRGHLDVTAEWVALNRAHNTLSDWARQRKEHLRTLRKAYPQVQLCCPRAINDALNAHNTLTHTELDTTGPGTGPGTCPGAAGPDTAGLGGAGLGGAGLGGAGLGGAGLGGAGLGGAGQMTVATAQAILAGPDTLITPGQPPVRLGCRWCDSTEASLPTIDELRADALLTAISLLARTLTDRNDGNESCGGVGGQVPVLAPRRGRRWSHAVVVVDLLTALGLAEEPGWIPGYGPVPATIARELAAEATAWQRFLLDDDGALISTGRSTYRPSDRLRELVTARDLTCTFPGCARPATTADLDHRINFNGTNTTPSNLHPLCRTHHRLKTHTGWHVQRHRTSGEDIWTSPIGRTYTHTPHPAWQPHDRPGGPHNPSPEPTETPGEDDPPAGYP